MARWARRPFFRENGLEKSGDWVCAGVQASARHLFQGRRRRVERSDGSRALEVDSAGVTSGPRDGRRWIRWPRERDGPPEGPPGPAHSETPPAWVTSWRVFACCPCWAKGPREGLPGDTDRAGRQAGRAQGQPAPGRRASIVGPLQHTHIVPILSSQDIPEQGLRILCFRTWGGRPWSICWTSWRTVHRASFRSRTAGDPRPGREPRPRCASDRGYRT